MTDSHTNRPRGRPRSAATQRLFDSVDGMLPRDAQFEAVRRECEAIAGPDAIARRRERWLAYKESNVGARREAHARQNAERAHHGAEARRNAERLVALYNDGFKRSEFGVLTTLVSQLLVVENAASVTKPTSFEFEECSVGYWPETAPRSHAGARAFSIAHRAGLGVQLGIYEDEHDLYPSRVGHPEPTRSADGTVQREHRKLAIGIDNSRHLIELGLRETRQLHAASFVVNASAGAWLGFMACDPPDDWDLPRTLWNPHWSPQFGHPACILPERRRDLGGLLFNSPFPWLSEEDRERGAEATRRVWRRRQRKGLHLNEPSFEASEAIKVLGSVVGICPEAEAGARSLLRFCSHRAKAGRLHPHWALRLCLTDSCDAPLFIHEVRPDRADASLPNYCKTHRLDAESQRQRRHRQRRG